MSEQRDTRQGGGMEVVGLPGEEDTMVLCSKREWSRWVDIAAEEQDEAERLERELEAAQAEIERLKGLLELAEFGANTAHKNWNVE